MCKVSSNIFYLYRFYWSRGLRCGDENARLLGLTVRIPLGEDLSVSCHCRVLSGMGFCYGFLLVQKSPIECALSECDLEAF